MECQLAVILAFYVSFSGVLGNDKIHCYYCSELTTRMARAEEGSSWGLQPRAEGSSAPLSGGAVIFPSGQPGVRSDVESASQTPNTRECQQPEDVDDEELEANPQIFGALEEVDVNTEGCYVLHDDNSANGRVVQRSIIRNSMLQDMFNSTENGCYHNVMKGGKKYFGCICRTESCNTNSAPVNVIGAMSLLGAALVAVVGGSRSSRLFI